MRIAATHAASQLQDRPSSVLTPIRNVTVSIASPHASLSGRKAQRRSGHASTAATPMNDARGSKRSRRSRYSATARTRVPKMFTAIRLSMPKIG